MRVEVTTTKRRGKTVALDLGLFFSFFFPLILQGISGMAQAKAQQGQEGKETQGVVFSGLFLIDGMLANARDVIVIYGFS